MSAAERCDSGTPAVHDAGQDGTDPDTLSRPARQVLRDVADLREAERNPRFAFAVPIYLDAVREQAAELIAAGLRA